MNYFLKQIVVIRIYINILKMHFSCYKDNKNSQKNGKIWINKVSVWY